MINKKVLIGFLSIALIMILYIINQVLFLNMLVDPSKSEYAWIDDNFTGYLLSNNSDYIDVATNFDQKTESCTLFIDVNTATAVYTNECKLKKPTYISESQPRGDEQTGVYNSIYEYLYGVKKLEPIDSVSTVEFPRYNEIFTGDDFDINKVLPDDINYTQKNFLYHTYSEDYKAIVINSQIKLLTVTCLIMLLLFVSGYVYLKRREIYVYKILGLGTKMLLRKVYKDIVIMLTSGFVIAIIVFSGLIWANGKLYYISMYFEYLNIGVSGLVYLGLLIVVSLIMVVYYMYLRGQDD